MVCIGHQSDIRARRTPERFERADFVPGIVRHRLVSVRVYDTDDMCIYDIGDVCDGTDVERLLERVECAGPPHREVAKD